MKSTIIIFSFTITVFVAGYYTAMYCNTRQSSIPALAHNVETKKLSQHANFLLTTEEDTKISAKKISQELSNAQGKIAYLQNINKNLANQIEQNNLPISSSVSYSDLVERIEMLPQPIIDEQLTHLFDDDGLQQINDSRDFTKRLLEVALTDSDNDNTQQTSIIFSTSPLQGSRLLNLNARVKKFDTIFAHITSPGNHSTLLVKWQRLNSGEIMLLTNQPINTNGREQYVFLRPQKGWQPGQYKISVHSMNDKITTLGVNLLTIIEIIDDDELSMENDQVLQDLIDSGQAFQKITD